MPKRTLKSIRYDLGLTQEEMAKKLGISLAAYKTRESYRTHLLASELLIVCKLSNVNMYDIKV